MSPKFPAGSFPRWLSTPARGLCAVLVLAVAVYLIFCDAADRRQAERANYHALLQKCAGGLNTPAPQPVASPFWDMDCWCWKQCAEQIFSGESLRIRRAEFDNAPYGRAVHWSAPFAWGIAGFAEVAKVCGKDSAEALQWGCDWISPLLHLALVGVCFGCGMVCGLGAIRSSLVALTAALTGIFFQEFSFGRCDHQGLHVLLIAIGLSAVLKATLTPRQANRWLVVAASFQAVALWVGATVQFPVVALVGLGGFLSAIAAARSGGVSAIPASAWRVWGRTGCVLSLLFYAVEYAPHFTIQLETNTPFHAFAWWGGAELIAWAATPVGGRTRRQSVLPLLAIVALPAAAVLGPHHWYSQGDPAVQGSYAGAGELDSILVHYASGFWQGLLADYRGILLILPLLGIARIVQWRAGRPRVPAVVLLVTLVLGGFAVAQARWQGAFSGCLAVLLIALLQAEGRRFATAAIFVSALCGGFLSWQMHRQRTAPLQAGVVDHFGRTAAVMTYVADAIEKSSPPGNRLIMSPPFTMACLLCDRAGARLVASPYWENIAGLRDAEHFFSATDMNEALRIAKARGVNFVLLDANAFQRDAAVCLPDLSGGTVPLAQIRSTLLYTLTQPGSPSPPAWLKPVSIRLPAPIWRDGAGMRLFQIVTE